MNGPDYPNSEPQHHRIAVWPGMKVYLPDGYDESEAWGTPLVPIEGEPGWYRRADDALLSDIISEMRVPRGGIKFTKGPDLDTPIP